MLVADRTLRPTRSSGIKIAEPQDTSGQRNQKNREILLDGKKKDTTPVNRDVVGEIISAPRRRFAVVAERIAKCFGEIGKSESIAAFKQ